jgi:hypothetical protein
MAQKVQKQAAGTRNQGSSEVVEDASFLGQRLEVEDPVARFIAANYNRILVLVTVGLIAWFGVGYYKKQNLQVSKAGGDVLASVQAALEDVINNPAEGSEDEQKKRSQALLSLEGGVKSLQQTIQPYPALAGLYSNVAGLESGKVKASAVKFYFTNGYSQGDVRFVEEMSDLAAAKYLLDEDLAAGKKALTALMEKTNYAAAAAAGVLTKLAEKPEEKKDLLKRFDDLAKRQPQIAGQLENFRKELE